ncbi:hypothetical protein HIM_05461 [Hirsutella minnesotensis 3608]|uniref:Uncharacterized protein n=1 Tax=Hirsutella minnesotensis 3608 TaxID=1043627 RepID=A0A0F8A0E1_9HYPO|nr:hypothetical protein HIM_05461 [Hirsutella minnesotensis 3608]
MASYSTNRFLLCFLTIFFAIFQVLNAAPVNEEKPKPTPTAVRKLLPIKPEVTPTSDSLEVRLDYGLYTNTPEAILFSSHLEFVESEPKPEISDRQLKMIAVDAYKEMEKMVQDYQFGSKWKPSVLTIVAVDNELILASSQRGALSITEGDQVSKDLDECRGDSENDHTNARKCGEVNAFDAYYKSHINPDRLKDNKNARVAAITTVKKGKPKEGGDEDYVIVPPCGTKTDQGQPGDKWGCNRLVEKLKVLSEESISQEPNTASFDWRKSKREGKLRVRQQAPSPADEGASGSGTGTTPTQLQAEQSRQWGDFKRQAAALGFPQEQLQESLDRGVEWLQSQAANLYGLLQRYPAVLNLIVNLGQHQILFSSCLPGKHPRRWSKRADKGQSEGYCQSVRTMVENRQDVPELCRKVKNIEFDLALSNDYWSGTYDKVAGTLEGPAGKASFFFAEAPSRGTQKTISVDMKKSFGADDIDIGGINKITLTAAGVFWKLDSNKNDQFQVQDIKVRAECSDPSFQARNNKFVGVNAWYGHPGGWLAQPFQEKTVATFQFTPADWTFAPPCTVIKDVRYNFKVGNTFGGGTYDKVRLTLGEGKPILLGENFAAGYTKEDAINLGEVFGKDTVDIRDLKKMALSDEVGGVILGSDAWTFQGITFSAACANLPKKVQMKKFESVNQEVKHKENEPVWTGDISPQDWLEVV